MDNILAVCALERNYVSRLADFLNKKGVFSFPAIPFDDIQKLKAYGETHHIEILLLGEEMLDYVSEVAAAQIIILSEEVNYINQERDFIFKYQSAPQILKALLGLYTNQDKCIIQPLVKKGNSKTQFIGVYSPVKRCLQTSFSLTMGQIFAKKSKCLYLNFENFSGFRTMAGVFAHDFMDLMYFLKDDRERFIYKFKSMTENVGGLDFIPPAVSFLDLEQIECSQWLTLLNAIEEDLDYDTVILDLSDSIRGLFTILEKCGHIYMITKPDGIAMAKIEQYEQMLMLVKKEHLINKIKKCEVPYLKKLPVQIEELPYSQLAEFVKKILCESNLFDGQAEQNGI